jgi:hypothetical protein
LKAFATRRTRFAGTLGARAIAVSDTRRLRLVHFHDPNLQHVADPHDLVRILDEAVRQPTDVNQRAVRQSNVHEHAEVDHVEHRAAEFHARGQIFEPDDSTAEHGRRKSFCANRVAAAIAAANMSRRVNCANRKLARHRRHIDPRQPLR